MKKITILSLFVFSLVCSPLVAMDKMDASERKQFALGALALDVLNFLFPSDSDEEKRPTVKDLVDGAIAVYQGGEVVVVGSSSEEPEEEAEGEDEGDTEVEEPKLSKKQKAAFLQCGLSDLPASTKKQVLKLFVKQKANIPDLTLRMFFGNMSHAAKADQKNLREYLLEKYPPKKDEKKKKKIGREDLKKMGLFGRILAAI